MVFKRRDARSWLQVVGHFFYPKGGWSRAAYYVLHRLRRLPDPPHKIARGVAVGVYVSFSPLFGFHFLFAALLNFFMQGNLLAALLATFFGNPLTFPFIAASSLELGHWMLGQPGGVHLPQIFAEFSRASIEVWQNMTAIFTGRVAHWDGLYGFFENVFLPYLVGGMVPGTILGIVGYMVTLPVVSAYQKRRVKKLKERYEKRRLTMEQGQADTPRE